MSDASQHLGPSGVMDSDHPAIQSLALRLAGGARDPGEIARSLFEHVRDRIAYSVLVPFHAREQYLASQTLSRGMGYCVQKAVLLATLARAAGIPARLAFADIRNRRASLQLVAEMGTDLFVYHSYPVLHLGGRWVSVAPTFDRRTCEAHGFPLVSFDGSNDALLPAEDPQGRPFVEYVAHHGICDDVPMDDLMGAWRRAYGDERVEAWIRACDDLEKTRATP
ncbi:MAG: transglutaminase family protein [Polyangia bacterium]|nr:transglutaminase family protein [Polyangia bacterium]